MNKIEKLIQELCPNGVEWKKLGEVCKIKNGKDYKHLECGSIPVWGTGGVMAYVNTFAYDKPSVLLPRKGSIDKIYYTEKPFWTVDTLFYTIIDTEQIMPKFLYICLSNIDLTAFNTSVGNRPSLTQPVLNAIEIPVPPLPVQTEIVRILDKFVEQQEQLEKLIELRKKQYEYYREEMLTAKEGEEWETKTLEEICSFVRGPFGGALKKEIFVESGFAVYEQQNAIYGNLNFRYFVDENKFNQMKSFHIHVGDLIMSCSGTMGKIFIIPENAPQGIINQALLKLTPKRNFSGKFIKKYIESNCFQKQLAKQTQGGAIQNVASVQILKKLLIDVPSFEKQNEIVNALDSFESSISALTSALELSKKRYEHYRDEMLRF